jgi:hypothetical protein
VIHKLLERRDLINNARGTEREREREREKENAREIKMDVKAPSANVGFNYNFQ